MTTKRIIVGAALSMGIMILLLSYGKWEYLSYQHKDEFVDAINNSFHEGCLLAEPIQNIKVMEYTNNHATVWIKGESQSTYLINLHKDKDNRSLRSTGNDMQRFCDREVINSSM